MIWDFVDYHELGIGNCDVLGTYEECGNVQSGKDKITGRIW